MSSVNSSSGSKAKYDEQIRRLKEEYKKREAEMLKKHSQEVRRLSKSNVSEIDRLRDRQNERMTNYQDKSRESLNRRDAKYQKEIDDMKKLHSKQLERMTYENEGKMQVTRDASSAESEQAFKASNDRAAELHTKYGAALNSKTQAFDQQLDEVREEQKESYQELRSEMQKRHETERKQLMESYQDQLTTLRNDLRTTRVSANQRLRDQELRHMGDKSAMQDDYMTEMLNREEAHADVQDGMRKGYAEGLKKLRDRQLAVNQENQEQGKANFDGLREEVGERMNKRENRLERQLTEERARNVRKEDRLHKEANREVNSWREDYQDKYLALEQEKRDAMEMAQKNNTKDIQKVRDETNKIMTSSHRQMQQSMDQDYLKSRTAIGALEGEMETRVDNERNRADTRITDIRENSYQSEEKLKRLYETNLETMKNRQEEELREIRMSMTTDKEKALQSISARSREKELTSQRQLQDVVRKYEKRISELHDQFVREKRLRDNRERQLVENLKKANDLEKEALAVKYSEINKQANQQHEKEMQDVSERHKDQVDNIMTVAKKT